MTSLIPKQVHFVSHHFLSPVQPLWLQKYLKVEGLGERAGRKGPEIGEVWSKCIWAGTFWDGVGNPPSTAQTCETEGFGKLSPAEKGHPEHMDRI